MDEASGSARPWLRALVAFAAGVALSVGAGLALYGGGGSSSAPALQANEPAVVPPAPPEPPALPAAPAESHPIAPSATLELDRAAFPASGPVRVSLELPEMSADAEPRPVQVFSMSDDRVFETQGRLDGERSAATIDLDPSWLRPGSYLVQVKTTERSHFPLRRYVIVVR